MRAAATAVLILLFVQGCVFPVGYCTRSEAPEVTQEQSTRDDVVAVLGEPYATTEVKGRSIDVYDYDGFCAGAWFVGIPIPQWRDKPGVLVVEYLDDTLVRAALLFDTTPGRVVAGYEGRAERLVSLEKGALAGDRKAMWSYAHALDDPKKAWVWFCRAANEGLPAAQYHLGNSYHHGNDPIARDVVQAYLWYSLSGASMDTRVLTNFIAEMTPDQIIEAERLLAEWEPNPTECETIAAQAEN